MFDVVLAALMLIVFVALFIFIAKHMDDIDFDGNYPHE